MARPPNPTRPRFGGVFAFFAAEGFKLVEGGFSQAERAEAMKLQIMEKARMVTFIL